jgi:hypothetical protein
VPPPENPDSAAGSDSSSALSRALRRLLRPLVHLLLARQITLPHLVSLLKELYVDVAESDFALEDKRQTDSRIHLLTGIHRKDIKRLRSRSDDEDAGTASSSLGTGIAARWAAFPRFQDESGHPRPLPRQSSSSDEASFEELVESVSRDIRPRAVLDEWIRLGVAHIDDQDRVVLEKDAFVPSRSFNEKAHFFGRNLQIHIAAAAQNLLDQEPPFVDRALSYGRLTPKSVDQLLALSEELGMEAIQEITRRAVELQESDENAPDASERVRFGIYTFRSESPESTSSEPLDGETEEPDPTQ